MNFKVKYVEFIFKVDVPNDGIISLERKFYEKMKIYASNTGIIEERTIENPNNKTKIITLQKMLSLNTFNNVMCTTINELSYGTPLIAEMYYDNVYNIIRVRVDL